MGKIIQGIFPLLYRPIMIFMTVVLICPAFAQADTFYVSPQGNDDWPGSLEKPFASLNAAQRQVKPGASVIVMEGVYPGPIRIDATGTEGAPILFRVADNADVVIDGTETEPLADLVILSGHHLIFEGFEVANAKGSGISLWGTTQVTLRGNTIHGSQRSGIFVGYSTRDTSKANLIEENIVYGNVLENKDRSMERRWASGIEISSSDGNIVRGNRSFRNFGEGISVMSSKETRVETNLFYDNYSVNIYLDNAQNSEVIDNTAGTSSNTAFFKQGKPAFGAAIADKEAPIALPSRGNTISGNVWVGVHGIFVDPALKDAKDALLRPVRPNITQPGAIRLQEDL